MSALTEDIRKFDFIDALRGYAILLVLLVHSSQAIAPTNATLQLLMNGGARGVQLFYVASALTLCLSWQFRNTNETNPLRNFFIRRFFRIAPMWYVAMVFYILLYGFAPRYFAPNGIEWWHILLTAIFLHGLTPETITSVVPGGWSIAVEMSFYLILPFLLRIITTLRGAIYFFLSSLVLYNISRIALPHLLTGLYPKDQQHFIHEFVFLNFFGQLPVFAIGIITYFIFTHVRSLKRTVIWGHLIFITALLLPSYGFLALITKHIDIAAAFALFALTLAVFPVKILVNRAIAQIGKISFSMYLSHFAVLHFFAKFNINALFEKGDASSFLYYLCVVAATAPLSYFLRGFKFEVQRLT